MTRRKGLRVLCRKNRTQTRPVDRRDVAITVETKKVC